MILGPDLFTWTLAAMVPAITAAAVNPRRYKTTGIAATATTPVPSTMNTDFLNKTQTESSQKFNVLYDIQLVTEECLKSLIHISRSVIYLCLQGRRLNI